MLPLVKTFFRRSGLRSEDAGVHRNPLHRSLRQANVPSVFRLDKLKGHDVYEINIIDLQTHFRKGDFSSVDYVQFCLDRIQKPEIDYYLESVIETNPDALAIASLLDKERSKGHVRGLLHGIPVLVKDNMATKDKMQTTAGSWALLGSTVPRDAHIVSQLREAGAVIIGHANMAEWAALRSKIYSSAYSPRRGEVRNPFDLGKNGSSAGSAVAVSANIVPLSYGTETDSSIIGPAGINAIVGIKPTVGLTSRSGVIPISEHMDTVGPFGRSVYDAALGLNAIAHPDVRDEGTLDDSRVQEADYTVYISDKSALKGARFGLPWRRCWEFVAKDQLEIAQKILNAMEALGVKLIRTNFPSAEERIPEDGEWDWSREYGEPDKSEFTVVKVDAYNGINAYLSELSHTEIKSIEDIVEYNIRNSGTEGANPGDHPAFPSGQDNFHEITQTKGIKSDTYQKALQYTQEKSRKEGIDGALKHPDGDFDALIMCDRNGVGQQMAAQAGYPIISIPIGLDADGLPVALTLHQTAWKEGILIKWASAIENLVHELSGSRPTPCYRNYLFKNVPVFE
ncbi:amidase [Zopfia rhizophila CBS 207.26]|uniref:Amidase n=1 Tax=Zopfia rhizophila CBS 207.26 TaxID=1314779 RepID=A0A6A6DQ18_9PEZI|nr:amidase [Zopfia rhizophila CBS 207.26]